MLHAFNARSIFDLGVSKYRIESLLAYGDKLLLGLSTGALQVYRVSAPDTADVSLELIQSVDNFARSAIQILACIKEAGILVSLADGNVNIHDLNDFSLTETLGKAKRASVLAVTSNIEEDEETEIPELVSRLAVGVKRRLLLYSWSDGGFQEGKEVVLGGNVRTLTWASGRKVIVGLQSGFVVVDARLGSAEEVLPAEVANGPGKQGENAGWASYVGMGGWGARSLSTRLSNDELLLVKDSTALFVDADGKPVPQRPTIPWSPPPDQVAYSYPFLVSLNVSKHAMEVRNPATWTLLQTISLQAATIVHVPPPNVALSHAGNLFYVASHNQVWRMGSTEYEAQINELVDAGQLDEAIKLIETLEDVLLQENKDGRLREVKMLKATKLFEQKKYEESMTLFAEVSAPPDRVIKLFPKSIAGELSIWQDKEEDSDAERDEVAEEAQEPGAITEDGENAAPEDDAATIQAAIGEEATEPPSPTSTADQNDGEAPVNPEAAEPVGEVAKSAEPAAKPNGIPTHHAVLRNKAFTKKYAETASIFSFGARRGTGLTDDSASILTKNLEPEPVKPLEGDELKKAALELAGAYLNDVRRKLTKYFAKGKPLDPVSILSKGSAHTDSKKDPLEASFMTLEAGEQDDDQEPAAARMEKVANTSMLIDTTLFRIYILFRPSMVGPLVRLQNRCDPDVVSEKLREQGKFKDLVDFLERKQLHREALELLRFFGQQPEEESQAPDLHGTERTVTYLQRLKAEHIDLILEFSQWPLTVSPDLAMEVFVGDTGNSGDLPRPTVVDYLEDFDPKLAIDYLEHLITELHDETPEFHTRLGSLYLAVLKHTPEPVNIAEWHRRFLEFLTNSSQYRAEKLLGWLPRDDPAFYEPRAVVLSKMGRHNAALEIYVFKLQDHDKAEKYCATLHHDSPPPTESAETPAPATIYHSLLSLYLRPPKPYKQQLEPALAILSRHGARLDASEALKLVPEDLKIQDLEAYFESRIRAANAKVSQNRLMAALGKVRLVNVQERFLEDASKYSVVADESVCPVCHKRLGQSVIWRLPTGQVVHYGCMR